MRVQIRAVVGVGIATTDGRISYPVTVCSGRAIKQHVAIDRQHITHRARPRHRHVYRGTTRPNWYGGSLACCAAAWPSPIDRSSRLA